MSSIEVSGDADPELANNVSEKATKRFRHFVDVVRIVMVCYNPEINSIVCSSQKNG